MRHNLLACVEYFLVLTTLVTQKIVNDQMYHNPSFTLFIDRYMDSKLIAYLLSTCVPQSCHNKGI